MDESLIRSKCGPAIYLPQLSWNYYCICVAILQTTFTFRKVIVHDLHDLYGHRCIRVTWAYITCLKVHDISSNWEPCLTNIAKHRFRSRLKTHLFQQPFPPYSLSASLHRPFSASFDLRISLHQISLLLGRFYRHSKSPHSLSLLFLISSFQLYIILFHISIREQTANILLAYKIVIQLIIITMYARCEAQCQCYWHYLQWRTLNLIKIGSHVVDISPEYGIEFRVVNLEVSMLRQLNISRVTGDAVRVLYCRLSRERGRREGTQYMICMSWFIAYMELHDKHH